MRHIRKVMCNVGIHFKGLTKEKEIELVRQAKKLGDNNNLFSSSLDN